MGLCKESQKSPLDSWTWKLQKPIFGSLNTMVSFLFFRKLRKPTLSSLNMTDLGKITEHGGRLRKSALGFNNFLDRFSLPAPLDFLNGFSHHTRKRTVLQENKPTRMGLSILDTSWTPPERFLERDLQGWTLLGYEIRRLSVGIDPTGTMPKPLTTSKKNRRKCTIYF